MNDTVFAKEAPAKRAVSPAVVRRRIERIMAKPEPKRQRRDLGVLAVAILRDTAAGTAKDPAEVSRLFIAAYDTVVGAEVAEAPAD